MSVNRLTVERYLEGFRRSDHAMVLSCLADDVEWLIPGMFHLSGKAAFDGAIEHEDFVGSPEITVRRMVEEGDTVVVEGTVQSERRDGGRLNAMFCDVFLLQAGKIRHLTSYLAELTA
jgi:ketosteroid isomerase-like protein